MHAAAKRLVVFAVALAAAGGLVRPRHFVVEAGNPHLAYYSPATDRVLWFVHTSDTHIGASGSNDSDRLLWLVTTGRTVINPSFIVVTGDLTDSTDGNFLGIPNGPHQAEWDQYRSLVDPYVDAHFYYDIPGNHDAYNDKDFAYYLANSVQGRATGQTQCSWTRTLSPTHETYHFVGVNTADNTGAGFSLSFPYGDHAGLDTTELAFLGQELSANAGASLTMVFGHHPVTDTGASGDTWLFYGQQGFVADLDQYRASVYGYGHTHRYSQVLFKGNSYTGYMSDEGIAYDNIASLGKSSSNNYSVVAIDCNGVSSIGATAKTWPVVLITAPVSASLGSAANPYAYPVPAAANDSIRALVFDAAQNPQVGFRIDSGTTWYPMTRVAAGSPLWQGAWDASALAAGNHTVEVRAVGTATKSHVITVSVTAAGNRPPVAANDGYTATSGTALVVAAPGVLANDADPDGNLIHAALVAGPQHGTLLLNADGSFTYTSAANFSGADAFTYAANDGTLTSGTATVTITVNPAQQGDTVTIKSATYARRTKTLAVTATSSAQPNATLTLVGYGQMTYSTKTKSYSLSVKTATAPSSVMVSSSLGGSKTASVTVK